MEKITDGAIREATYIPFDLIRYLDGVRKFRFSLKCAITSRPIRITKVLGVKFSSLFEEIRISMKSLEIEQIKEILRIEIRKQILHKILSCSVKLKIHSDCSEEKERDLLKIPGIELSFIPLVNSYFR